MWNYAAKLQLKMLISVSIIRQGPGLSIVQDWNVISVTGSETLRDVFTKLQSDTRSHTAATDQAVITELTLEKCTIGPDKVKHDDITDEANVTEATEFGRFLRFVCKDDTDSRHNTSSGPAIACESGSAHGGDADGPKAETLNAFDVLMS